MAKNKFYVVWKGKEIGVFSTWDSCKMQIEGFKGAQYKSFPDRSSAESAFRAGYEASCQQATAAAATPSYESMPENLRPIGQSIAVDAACSGNPGKMEFQGVFVETKTHLFKSPVYEQGTNNIGEFLAIVYCLAWQKKNKIQYPIYSDSVNAQKWVREGVCKTKIVENDKNRPLFDVIRWAERWLKENSFRVPIYKWRTEIWGEIPADFGRK
ncbi:MAG: ribonuclease H family protein [Bacteroidales bacterium]|nr:ribonuclease H family protein [Bacteroidales bacterium]MBR5782173.1 ribonuclease H family protein [Bacteroidales bacterium]